METPLFSHLAVVVLFVVQVIGFHSLPGIMMHV